MYSNVENVTHWPMTYGVQANFLQHAQCIKKKKRNFANCFTITRVIKTKRIKWNCHQKQRLVYDLFSTLALSFTHFALVTECVSPFSFSRIRLFCHVYWWSKVSDLHPLAIKPIFNTFITNPIVEWMSWRMMVLLCLFVFDILSIFSFLFSLWHIGFSSLSLSFSLWNERLLVTWMAFSNER